LLAHYIRVDPKYQHLYQEWKEIFKNKKT